MRIRQKESAIEAALQEGQQARAERLAERLAELKTARDQRDKARNEQKLLEAADALPTLAASTTRKAPTTTSRVWRYAQAESG